MSNVEDLWQLQLVRKDYFILKQEIQKLKSSSRTNGWN
jgi:hypothetical protein